MLAKGGFDATETVGGLHDDVARFFQHLTDEKAAPEIVLDVEHSATSRLPPHR